jgi:hypothetical protein
MLRVTNLSNVFQKRLIRPLYAHTQATPYAAVLDASLRNADNSFRPPVSTDTLPLARSANAFTLQGGIVPGTVMVKVAGEAVVVAPGGNTAVQPFGLLANFVGGTLDDIKDENNIGVWRGPDSTFEILAPGFDDTGLATAYATANTTGIPVKLFAGTDGRLTATNPGGSAIVVAHLIERTSASKIVIDLKI